jgi:hypothetical protein
MPTMNVPGIGNVEKKYVYISAAGVAGFVGYMYWRNRQANASASTDTSTTDTSTTDTGASDLGSTFDPSAYSYDYSGSAPTYQAPINQTIPVTSNQQITTDAAWDSAAIAQAGDMGADPAALSSALGRFLAGLCVSNAQADLVRQAEGMLGRPPQSPNLQIHICPASGDSGGTPIVVPGFHVTGTDKSGISYAWTAVSGADYYHIHIEGNGVSRGYNIHSTSTRIGSLKSKKKYYAKVHAVVGGKTGPDGSLISGTTK